MHLILMMHYPSTKIETELDFVISIPMLDAIDNLVHGKMEGAKMQRQL